MTKAYIGIDRVTHKIKKAYIGVGGVARLFYEAEAAVVANVFRWEKWTLNIDREIVQSSQTSSFYYYNTTNNILQDNSPMAKTATISGKNEIVITNSASSGTTWSSISSAYSAGNKYVLNTDVGPIYITSLNTSTYTIYYKTLSVKVNSASKGDTFIEELTSATSSKEYPQDDTDGEYWYVFKGWDGNEADKPIEYNNTFTVSKPSSSIRYGFNLNYNGYYESSNNEAKRSYSLAKIDFVLECKCNIILTCINYAEAGKDYGILGNVDKTLTSSYLADTNTANIKKKFSATSDNKADPVNITYTDVPAGNHYIYAKYIKNQNQNSNNDSFQFKVTIVPNP